MSKISILIPVYNVECYLKDCLDSVVKQSEPDIEIICVEDASTDNSLRILEEYAASDRRIRILRHDINKGLCQTRKDAVQIAKGEYIMFLDSDDYLSLDACAKLYQEIERRNADFLQFGTQIVPTEFVSEEMVAWVDNFMTPSVERIEGDALLKACFMKEKFNCNLVNKIWRTECCKKAYEKILDGYYVSAEDRYATFILAYYAKSYEGSQEKFYHYRLGIGVTGGEVLDLERFEKRCKGTQVIANVKMFLQEEKTFDQYKEVFEAFANDILWDCVDCWYNKLEKENSTKGYDILLKYWRADEIVSAIARRYFEALKEVEEKSIGKDNYRVAIYYRYIGYDVMDFTLLDYTRFYEQHGSDVCFLTDTDAPEEQDNYKNHSVIHIPATTDSNWERYQSRGKALAEFLMKYKINEVCYLSPTSHILLFDKMLVESMNVKCKVCMDEYAIDRHNQEKKLLEEHRNIEQVQ